MDILTALGALGVPAGYVTAIIAAASVLSAVLPQAPEGSPWAKPRALLDLLAVNVHNAANAPKP